MTTLPWSIATDTRFVRYAMAVALVFAIGLCLSQVGELVSEDNEMLLYLGGLIFAALYLGRGPTRAATVTSLLILNLGRIHPGFRIGFQKFQYVISFGIFLLVSDQIARLADGVRREAWRAKELYFFTQECSRLNQPAAVTQLLQQHARWYCGVDLDVQFVASEGTPLKTPRGTYAWTCQTVQSNLLLESLMAQTALALERISQAELMRQASVLEATQQLQSTLINSISHDLQTPLSSIRGSVETLRSCSLGPAEQAELLDMALEQIRRLQKLVQNILNSSKMEGGGLQLMVRRISFDEVVQGVVDSFPARVRGQVVYRLREPAPEVCGDFALLSQLVSNLLDNALKFSSDQVELEVSAEGGEGLRLSVKDRGCGIEAEDLPHVFERFYRGQTPRLMPGSGLGLNICKAVADLHHGRLQVFSHPGQGSEFVLTLPIHRDASHV